MEKHRDFLHHLESYLSKRDGVDKLLKISRYTAKLILSSTLLPPTHPLTPRLTSFDSSVGLSRKAFRLGKFIQSLNALLTTARGPHAPPLHLLLSLLAHGGEGVYYFLEQIVWLSKSGLLHARHARELQKVSAWAELVGYIGSVSLKVGELRRLGEELRCLRSSIEIAGARGEGCEEERERERVVVEKVAVKRLSVVQDLADALMAVADVRGGRGRLSSPLLLSSAGLLSAVISTHKNWKSC